LGSGSTLIAAEESGRLAYGIEIIPEYLALTLQRASEMPLELEILEIPNGMSIDEFLKSLPSEEGIDLGLAP